MSFLVALTFVATGAAATSFVIRGDARIGNFYVKRDGTLGGMVKAFGEPASRDYDNVAVSCTVRWPEIGLKAYFANFGGGDPCGNGGGRFSSAIMSAPGHWLTGKGLRLGATAFRLRQLYPRATFDCAVRRCANDWWLATRTSPYGGGAKYPALLAHMKNGRVAWFRVEYPAAGD
jgi:hypothetical protein